MGNTGKTVPKGEGLSEVYSPITVDDILTPEDSAEYAIETKKYRVQLRQTVTTMYPASRGNALFRASEFGDPQSFVEKRVAWLDVPEGVTPQDVMERLNALECPTLVRVLDLKPILTESQVKAMETGLNKKTMEEYREDFVRSTTTNEPVLFKNHYQYRHIRFSDTFAEDEDNRELSLREIIANQRAIQMAAPETQVAQPAQAEEARTAGTF